VSCKGRKKKIHPRVVRLFPKQGRSRRVRIGWACFRCSWWSTLWIIRSIIASGCDRD